MGYVTTGFVLSLLNELVVEKYNRFSICKRLVRMPKFELLLVPISKPKELSLQMLIQVKGLFNLFIGLNFFFISIILKFISDERLPLEFTEDRVHPRSCCPSKTTNKKWVFLMPPTTYFKIVSKSKRLIRRT